MGNSHYGNEEINIGGLIRLIDRKKPKCLCGAVLIGNNITYRPHKDGVRIQEMASRQWVSVYCDKCGRNTSLWKISRKLRGWE